MTTTSFCVFVTMEICCVVGSKRNVLLTYHMPNDCLQKVRLDAAFLRLHKITSWQALCTHASQRCNKQFNAKQGLDVYCLNAFELNAFDLQKQFEEAFKFEDENE